LSQQLLNSLSSGFEYGLVASVVPMGCRFLLHSVAARAAATYSGLGVLVNSSPLT
jgi:hypothetical protein